MTEEERSHPSTVLRVASVTIVDKRIDRGSSECDAKCCSIILADVRKWGGFRFQLCRRVVRVARFPWLAGQLVAWELFLVGCFGENLSRYQQQQLLDEVFAIIRATRMGAG